MGVRRGGTRQNVKCRVSNQFANQRIDDGLNINQGHECRVDQKGAELLAEGFRVEHFENYF